MTHPCRTRAAARGLFTVAVVAALCGLGACATTGPFVWARDLPLPPARADMPVGPRDSLLVHAVGQKDISGEFIVRDDGTYLQPPIGVVAVAGMTPAQVGATLAARLQGIIVNTQQISVSVPRRAPIKVHVVGEVRTPSTYDLDRDRSVTAALAAAGWLNDYASEDRIFVLRPKDNPARIRFRAVDLKGAEPHSALFQLRDGDTVVAE